MKNDLKQRWNTLWADLGLKNKMLRGIIWLQIKYLYSHPRRGYHNLENHIQHCFCEYDQVKDRLQNPLAVAFAIYFHDAIYNTRLNGIEERCAKLAYRISLFIGLSKKFATIVYNLILASRHIDTPSDNDTKYFVDIDLSSLALPPVGFENNTTLIRLEYGDRTDREFAAGRYNVLQKLLKRDSIYYTDYYKNKCEAQARTNLTLSSAKFLAIMQK
jgi:predicted metal-dependent HD superfamily phosphohydrolase